MLVMLGGLAPLLPAGGAFGSAGAPALSLVSVGLGGAGGNGWSDYPSLSYDGRYVAFASAASNLVSGDTNGLNSPLVGTDVFRYDRLSGQTIVVSVASDGAQADSNSGSPSISSDGRYVAFWSDAGNLVPDDHNGARDIFLRDCVNGTTARLSLAGDGSEANGASDAPCLSGDAGRVAFISLATNLAPNDTNENWDVFVRDRVAGTTVVASVDDGGVIGNGRNIQPSLSLDGSCVAFASRASNLVSGDTNSTWDIFVHDLRSHVTTLETVSSGGVQADRHSSGPSLSEDGRFVAFTSIATTLAPNPQGTSDLYLRDRVSGTTTNETTSPDRLGGGGPASPRALSADGRYVALESGDPGIVPPTAVGIAQALRFDRDLGAFLLLSTDDDWAPADRNAVNPTISGDGRYVAFASRAGSLVAGDANGEWDVFVSDATAVAARLIQAHRPDSGALSEPRWGSISICFNLPVEQASASSHFSLTSAAGAAVAGTFTWPVPGRKMLFAPSRFLAAATTYRAGFTAGVRYRGSRALANAEGYWFSTADQPVVIGITPAGASAPVGTAVGVTFDQPMHRPSVQRSFRLTPAAEGVFSWSGSRRLTFRPTAPLAPATEYEVRVGRTARSASGHTLGRAYVATFTSAAAPAMSVAAVPAPARDGTVPFAITLSAPATVRLSVSNIAGRRLFELPPSALPQGTSWLTWNGLSNRGTKVAGGWYLATIEATDDHACAARRMVSVRVPGTR